MSLRIGALLLSPLAALIGRLTPDYRGREVPAVSQQALVPQRQPEPKAEGPLLGSCVESGSRNGRRRLKAIRMRHNTRGLLLALAAATVGSCALTCCDRRAQRTTRQVAADLSSADPADREWAADELSRRGPAAAFAVPELIKALRTEREDDARWRVARALGNVGDKAAVPSLVQTLDDDCAMVRTEAAIALGKLGRKGAHDALAAHLDDPTPHVRVHVAEALALLGDVDLGLPTLIEGLDELRYQVRYCAAHALADIGPPAAPAVPTLTRRLSDSEAKVRREVARALGEVGQAALPAIPELAELQDSEEGQEGEFARTAIAKIRAAADEAERRRASEQKVPATGGQPPRAHSPVRQLRRSKDDS